MVNYVTLHDPDGELMVLSLRADLWDDDPDRYPEGSDEDKGQQVQRVQHLPGPRLGQLQEHAEGDDELVGADRWGERTVVIILENVNMCCF